MAKSDPARRLPDEELVSRIAEAERSLGISTQVPRKYLRFSNWFIEARHFRTLLWAFLKHQRVGIFPPLLLQPRRKAWSRLWKSWRPGGALVSPLSADIICVRNNIRTFYPTAENPFTIKLRRADSDEGRRAIAGEIAASRRASETGRLHVPQQLSGNDNGFIVEEIITGRSPLPDRDGAVLRGWLENELWPHYEQQGFEMKPISEIIDLEHLPEICKEVGWSPPDGFLGAAEAFASSDRKVILTTVHGDLSVANLLISSDGSLCVVDWESSRVAVIGRDLWALVREVPGAREIFAERFAALPALDLDGQLLVHVFERILDWARHNIQMRTPAQRDAAIRDFLDHASRLLPEP